MRSFEEKRALESRKRLLAAASSLGREVICWLGVERTEVAVITFGCGAGNSEGLRRRVELEW
jgi:predicted alpha/beta hydrolase